MKRKTITGLLVLVAHLLEPQLAQAQSYPCRPIKLVVPSPAGGPPDVMARLSDRMAASLGQPVIVDNRGGAGGTIGARAVLAAEPDGYTILMGSSTLLVAPNIYKKAPVSTRIVRASRSRRGRCGNAWHPSVGSGQLHGRVYCIREVQAGHAELRLGRDRNASPISKANS